MLGEQIKKIRKYTNIQLEHFIHGALCVSYSGQCYMSAYNGSRSANRGECAQCCRKKYSLVDKNGKILLKNQYLLSLKDNNLSNHLDKLIEAGVMSFKIEGRLKDENYVKNTVLYYHNKGSGAIFLSARSAFSMGMQAEAAAQYAGRQKHQGHTRACAAAHQP